MNAIEEAYRLYRVRDTALLMDGLITADKMERAGQSEEECARVRNQSYANSIKREDFGHGVMTVVYGIESYLGEAVASLREMAVPRGQL